MQTLLIGNRLKLFIRMFSNKYRRCLVNDCTKFSVENVLKWEWRNPDIVKIEKVRRLNIGIFVSFEFCRG